MMDKQINLYRNVMRAEQRRKKFLMGLAAAVALGLMIAWGFSQRFVSLKVEMIQEAAAVEASFKSEQAQVETLSQEIKNRDAAAKNVQGDFAAALAQVSRASGPTAVSQLATIIEGWRGAGARLKKIELDGERLTIAGEASSREAARLALEELSALVSSAKAWAPAKASIAWSKEDELVGFELTAAREQAAPPQASEPPAPAPKTAGGAP